MLTWRNAHGTRVQARFQARARDTGAGAVAPQSSESCTAERASIAPWDRKRRPTASGAQAQRPRPAATSLDLDAYDADLPVSFPFSRGAANLLCIAPAPRKSLGREEQRASRRPCHLSLGTTLQPNWCSNSFWAAGRPTTACALNGIPCYYGGASV